jgi:hypothetical protein
MMLRVGEAPSAASVRTALAIVGPAPALRKVNAEPWFLNG